MLQVGNNYNSYDALNMVSSLSDFYDSLTTKITYKSTEYLINGADLWTGSALARTTLETELYDNQQFLSNTDNAISLVQDTQFRLSGIEDNLDRMETLAEMAASGSYTAGEVAGFQTEFDALIARIDTHAISASIQDENMLSYNGTYDVEIEEGITTSIDTLDATISGLGILENIDLTADPDSALAGVQNAIGTVQAYSDTLTETEATLEAAHSELLDHQQDIKQMYSSVSSTNSAMQVISELANLKEDTTALMMIAQANESVQNALLLLLDE